ncbi:unnamed protein product [Pieris brassicae]|uniref:Uncharacterized protein n=1 Tax=Pieris brassicae TaxID=7116 RepID=A0A9P0SXV7_PIEBR|nr:unnamed protein product [Pieris brassicae]
MSASVCFIYLFLAIIRSSSDAIETDSKICFPKKFMFGVATAAYQIEGAWNVSGYKQQGMVEQGCCALTPKSDLFDRKIPLSGVCSKVAFSIENL